VRSPTTIRVNDDFSASQAGIALREDPITHFTQIFVTAEKATSVDLPEFIACKQANPMQRITKHIFITQCKYLLRPYPDG